MAARVSMAFEIERKFLVTSDGWQTGMTSSSHLRQAYLTHQDKASVRVRIWDNVSATLTIKSRGAGLRRLELEYEIPVIEAEAMLPLRHGAVIEKIRARVPFEGHVWEVDTFLGDNLGLVVAEIELPTEDHVFTRPAWVGTEVTGQARYYNGALAICPFKTWASESCLSSLSDRAPELPASHRSA